MLISALVYFFLGVLFGYLGGLFGIGGGLVAIPVLGVFFGYSEQVAQGTALVMIVPNVLLGLWHYVRKVGLDTRLAVTLAVTAVPFTFAGAHFATVLPSAPLRIAFAIFIAAIAAQMAWRTFAPTRVHVPHRYPWPLAGLVGAIGGTLSGFFSVGGAVFAVPAMSSLFGLSQVAAQGMGLALVAPGTIVSILTYAAARDVAWIPGIALALGGAISVPHGVNLAKRLPERVLRGLFAVLMLASAVRVGSALMETMSAEPVDMSCDTIHSVTLHRAQSEKSKVSSMSSRSQCGATAVTLERSSSLYCGYEFGISRCARRHTSDRLE